MLFSERTNWANSFSVRSSGVMPIFLNYASPAGDCMADVKAVA